MIDGVTNTGLLILILLTMGIGFAIQQTVYHGLRYCGMSPDKANKSSLMITIMGVLLLGLLITM